MTAKKGTSSAVADWLLASPQPWVRLGTLVSLLDRPHGSAEVRAARRASVSHAFARAELACCSTWPGPTLTRHNNAKHPLHHLALLPELGFSAADPELAPLVRALTNHRDPKGALQCWMMLPRAFGGDGVDQWCWVICDAPVLAHALLALGAKGTAIRAAVSHVAGACGEQGYRCTSSFPKMHGPGRKDDPCPYATLLALRALALSPAHRDGPAAHSSVEVVLGHWERQKDSKLKMFGIGTEYRKLKFPLIWYDVLHVTDVISRFPWARRDPRFVSQVELVRSKADAQGRFTPQSVWMAWKGADFAQKREPSPTLTLVAHRMLRRVSQPD